MESLREFHVDQAVKYHQTRKDSPCIVGYVDRYNPAIRGAVILHHSLIKKLRRDFKLESIHKIQNELHAAVLFLLTRERVLSQADRIILCGDYNFGKVMSFLTPLIPGIASKFISILKFRLEPGVSFGQKSFADNYVHQIAEAFPKGRNIHRRKPVLDSAKVIDYKELVAVIKLISSSPLIKIETINCDNPIKNTSITSQQPLNIPVSNFKKY